MNKFTHTLAMVAVAALPFSMTSCDDDPWFHDGPHDEWDNDLIEMAQVLCGEWDGTMTYYEALSDGSRQQYEFYANMEFYQYGNSSNSLSGNGVEVDETRDANGNVTDSQTLKFSWYIDEQTGNIYVRYENSGSTFVLDNGSTTYGFHVGPEKGHRNDTFYGYMIGTNNDDVIYIDLERVNSSSYAKAANGKTVTPASSIFGSATSHFDALRSGSSVQQLINR